MTNYEEVRQLVESLTSAPDGHVREVKWLTDAQVVGVARSADGRVEVFLRGPELKAFSSVVRDVIEFRVVHRTGLPSFGANRILLPALGYFDQVAAFICTEILREGADSSLVDAFAKTELIIELAVERTRLSSQSAVGLAGELLLIDALLRRARGERISSILKGWEGWRRSTRDLRVDGTGVEVKTTTGPASSHLVSGVHQVERYDGSFGGDAEDRLLVVSIGLEPTTEEGNAFTIPQLVSRIIARAQVVNVPDFAIQTFVSRVAEYGADFGGGYEHGAASVDSVYCTAFFTVFVRAYNMDDPAIEVLRRRDVAGHAHVDMGSVRFRMDLPAVVGLENPIVGANQVADLILG